MELTKIEEMLFEISGDDITKFDALRRTKISLIYKAVYRKRLLRFNELIETLETLGSMED